jgi:hypothetical protein
MTNMENMDKQLAEHERQAAVYAAAMERINADRLKQEAQGYMMIGGAMAYGEGALGTGLFGKASQAAKLFCILFAMLAPSLAVWKYLL